MHSLKNMHYGGHRYFYTILPASCNVNDTYVYGVCGRCMFHLQNKISEINILI